MGVIKLKKLRFLDALPEKVYNVTITNIKPNGIYFDIDFIGFEGFIHVSELGREYFHYHPERRTFTGEQTNTSYHIGKSIRVRLTQLSLLTQSCTWAIL